MLFQRIGKVADEMFQKFPRHGWACPQIIFHQSYLVRCDSFSVHLRPVHPVHRWAKQTSHGMLVGQHVVHPSNAAVLQLVPIDCHRGHSAVQSSKSTNSQLHRSAIPFG